MLTHYPEPQSISQVQDIKLNRSRVCTYSVCSEVDFEVGELSEDLLAMVATILDLAVLLMELEWQGLVPTTVLAARSLLGCWSCRW